jgi:HPt (histidine-containing phosphotransfer) domain-containing protein
VALTANALTGNDEMFLRHGFDGFIPKPIDIRRLNAVLNKFVRDRHPEEAKENKPQAVETAEAPDEKRVELLQIFRRDAEKAVITMRKTAPRRGEAGGNLKLFTTTAHAMKSALSYVGETEISMLAAALEQAGLKGNRDFIADNTESFIETIEALIKELSPAQTAAVGDADVTEDTAYLKEQMQIIKAACTHYDDTVAYAALDRLKEKPWKPQTAAVLEEIRDILYLHSDFDGAAEQAGGILEKA